jgi:hypothetical protein
VVLQKQVDAGLVDASSFGSDLNLPSESAPTASAPLREYSTGSHYDFIKETGDLPSSAQRALDKIYKVDPQRARELSRQAHEIGVQDLPDQ